MVSQDYTVSMEGDIHRLTIPEVFDEDAGRFTVHAENPSGKTSCSAVLTVAPPLPLVSAPPQTVQRAPSQTVQRAPTQTVQRRQEVSVELPETPGHRSSWSESEM